MSLKSFLNKRCTLHGQNAPHVKEFKPSLTGLFEDVLSNGSSLRIRVTGKSMAPFIRDGEIVTIRKTPGSSFRRGDLIFFKNDKGLPVLHRMIKRDKSADKILTKGDALTYFDRPVRDNDVMGKVSIIEKKNSFAGLKYLHMDSSLWISVNYFIASLFLVRSKWNIASSILIKKLGS
jgi:signal peptidase I